MSSKKDLKNLAITGLVSVLVSVGVCGAIKHIDSKQKYIPLGDARIETRDSNGKLVDIRSYDHLIYNPKNNTFKEEENNIYKHNLVPVDYKFSK